MDLQAFTKPFGNMENHSQYFTFVPDKLPPQITYDETLTTLIGEASLQLGNLSGIGKLIPNPHLLIRPYLRREAVLSSKIEGTQASILDVFRFEADGLMQEKEKDRIRIKEVVNYVRALDECLKDVNNGKKIGIEMIKKAHKILMNDVRGNELHPGELRTVQNWIGIEGTKIEDATYVPPPPDQVYQLLLDLEHFIQSPPGMIPVLIQCAMIHYMFEAIHPFGDGNGRIGRLLIPVLLAERKLLNQPLLYLSAYIEQRKTEYYSLLLSTSQKSDWTNWIKFFLKGVIHQSQQAVENIQKLISLKAVFEQKLNSRNASRSMSMIVDCLFSNPIVTISGAAQFIGITYHPAKNAIDRLEEIGILEEYGYRQRHKTYVAQEILKVLSGE